MLKSAVFGEPNLSTFESSVGSRQLASEGEESTYSPKDEGLGLSRAYIIFRPHSLTTKQWPWRTVLN